MKNQSKNIINPNPYNLLQKPRRVRCLTVLLEAEKKARQKAKKKKGFKINGYILDDLDN
ncbi:MAG: hypothetical protein GY710_05620 [Desulfobacteraceae bacterium]|nr:hypothetical protein [Desulfobacteraceae bacterium]